MFQCYFFHRVGFIVVCRKSNGSFSYFPDTAVGNSDAVCIAAEIFDCVTESIESFFDIRTPFFLIEVVTKFIPFIIAKWDSYIFRKRCSA